MEKIYILDKDGSYTEASELDKAIKEAINERDKQRDDGDSGEDQDQVRELAPSEVSEGGTDSVGEGHSSSPDSEDNSTG